MLPTFLVIGAAKCGTTSVCDLLRQHPEVFVTEPKEPVYFTRDSYLEQRAWYEGLFVGAAGHRAAGEGSVAYTLPGNTEVAAPRIRRLVPDCRLVYMVRHPIRRLESDWKMRTIEGYDIGPIENALEIFPGLATIGAYWSHVSVYRRHFSDEQLLIVFLEDFMRDTEVELRRIFRHLGVDQDVLPDSMDQPRNTSEDRRRTEAVAALERVVPSVRRLKPLLPRPVKDLGSRLLALTKPAPSLSWTPTTYASVVNRLSPDAARLLDFCGKPADFWSFDGPPHIAAEG